MPNKSIDKNEDSVEKIPNSVEEILKDLYDGEKVKKIYPPVKVIGEVSFKPFEDRPQTYFILGEDGNLYEPNEIARIQLIHTHKPQIKDGHSVKIK